MHSWVSANSFKCLTFQDCYKISIWVKKIAKYFYFLKVERRTLGAKSLVAIEINKKPTEDCNYMTSLCFVFNNPWQGGTSHRAKHTSPHSSDIFPIHQLTFHPRYCGRKPRRGPTFQKSPSCPACWRTAAWLQCPDREESFFGWGGGDGLMVDTDYGDGSHSL